MKLFQFTKRKKILFITAVFLIIAIFVAILAVPKQNVDEDVIWREYPVAYNDIIAALDGGGTLEATGIHHNADVDLKIEQILVRPGQEVKVGEILVKYSKEDLQKKIDELTIALQTAEHTLEDAKSNKLKAQLESQLANVQGQQDIDNAYTSSKQELENTIQNAQERIRRLRENITAWKSELEQLVAKGTDDSKLAALQQQKEELYVQLDKVNAEIQVYAGDDVQLAGFQEQKQSLEQQIAEADSQVNAKTKENEDIENKIASLQQQIQQAETEMEQAGLDISVQQQALANLNSNYEHQCTQLSQNQDVQGQINDLNNETMNRAIENAQADVDKARNALEEAQKLILNPVLTAKESGVITEISYSEGDEVSGGKSIVTIGDGGEKQVITQVSQEDIVNVQIGQIVEMQFLSNPDETLKGTVIEKSMIPSEGGDGVTYKVTLGFDEPQPELLQGMTCSVKFILKRVEHVLTLSNKAITLKDGKQVVVILLPDGTHEEREIQTGFSDGRVSEIISGLSNGDIVVTEG